MQFTFHVNYWVGLLLLAITCVVLLGMYCLLVWWLLELVSEGWQYIIDRRRWYRPSRRACRQVEIARKKHAKLLEAYLKLRHDHGLDRKHDPDMIRWDYPTLEQFINANYWHFASEEDRDIRAFIAKQRVEQAEP